MKLVDFASANLRYDSSALSQDIELSKEVQGLLIDFGLLSEIETPFGKRAIGALTRFQINNNCYEPDFLGPETAAKLIEASESGTRAPASIITLEATQNTVLKLRPLNSTDLEAAEKYDFAAGEKLELTYYEPVRKHLILTLSKELNGSPVWYAFSEHVKVVGGETGSVKPTPANQKPTLSSVTPANTIKLNVPYKSQRDNVNNPDGSCNVTSIAMCLEFLGISRKCSGGQFEDELYQYALDHNLSRNSPYDLAKIVQDYGAKDAFDSCATIEEVKKWLASGNPAVTHGYFTSSGHIIVLAGYDESGFLAEDPYGEWCPNGYDRNVPGSYDTKGKDLHYSYQLIQRTCCTDNEFWVHFISK
ncbi:MAG: C39 family peptidase [Thermosynechococcaceae cyanobacterium]